MIADAEQGGPMSGRLHECMHACELLQNRRGKLSGKRDKRAAYVLTKVKRNPAVEGSRARRLFFMGAVSGFNNYPLYMHRLFYTYHKVRMV